jgi:hypothetical protein
MQLFVDLDGVLADFDAHYETQFGIRSSKLTDDVDWLKVRAIAGFYLSMPPMSDAMDLWAHVAPHRPTVLTGTPPKVEEAAENKRAWVRQHLGPGVPVICCRSSEKSLHMRPGDILVDDWEKYRHLWIARGGRWVTHVTAKQTISQLRSLGID